jgi:hypothetical protein
MPILYYHLLFILLIGTIHIKFLRIHLQGIYNINQCKFKFGYTIVRLTKYDFYLT